MSCWLHALQFTPRSSSPPGIARASRPRPERAPLGPLAERARWALPGAVACVVVRSAGRFAVPGADGEVLSVNRGSDIVLIVPEPETGGLIERVRAAARGRVTVVGPAVPVHEAWLSLQCARLALDRRAERPTAPGAEPGDGAFLHVDDELAELHLLRSAPSGSCSAGGCWACSPICPGEGPRGSPRPWTRC
ncbi:hypothetical protein AB5J55_03480 [Streptomyces sp. R11]|uniref:RCK C-terminal domain-containing protein n=1 Tax=Streptomyces sp. R11 TaxID=3238625 RepID=A0AB39MTT6_9ACTN